MCQFLIYQVRQILHHILIYSSLLESTSKMIKINFTHVYSDENSSVRYDKSKYTKLTLVGFPFNSVSISYSDSSSVITDSLKCKQHFSFYRN